MVYTSGNRSLAALETLVHLNPPMFFKYVFLRLEFDDALVEKIAPASLPVDWRDEPPPLSTKQIGDLWIKEARSAVLELPSAIVPYELNYLLNPAQPDFEKILIGEPEPLAFDPRLLS